MKNILTFLILWYLSFFARLALKLYPPKTMIGIAGSVGKSSTRNALFVLLNTFDTTKSIGNSETGIPLGILGITPHGYSIMNWIKMLLRVPFGISYLKGTTYLIVEMGIDDPFPPKNMSYLLSIIQPDIGILVSESAAHTYQFEKTLSKQEQLLDPKKKTELLIERIAAEDMKMVQNPKCKTIVYNNDNLYITKNLKNIIGIEDKKLLSFGEDSYNDISYKSYSITEKGTDFTFTLNNTDELSLTFQQLYPTEYCEVFSAALITTIDLLGISKRSQLEELGVILSNNLTLPKGRATVLRGINNSTIIDSSYNASKISVAAFLKMTADLKKKTGKKVTFIFGDMRELGNEAEQEHKEVAELISNTCDSVYLVGPLTRQFVLPILKKTHPQKVQWFSSNIEVGEHLKHNLIHDSLVLVKGSQNTIFLEESIKFILESKKDIHRLCRQDQYWLSIKSKQGLIYKK